MKIIFKCPLLIVVLFAASATLSAGTIVSIDPNSAQLSQSIAVAVEGQGTHFEQGTQTLIWLSQGSHNIYSYGYYPYTDTLLIVWFDIPVDAETGLYDLKVYNGIDGTLTLNDGFTIAPGGIVSVNPNNGQQGQSLSVTITGRDTHFHQGTEVFNQGTPTNVWLSGFSQESPTVYLRFSWSVSDTLLIATFDIPCDAPTGLHNVSVQNDIDGILTLYNGFTINSSNPILTSITPRGAYQGQKLSVTITGQNTHFQMGTTTFAQATSTVCQGTPTTTWFFQGSPTTNSCAVWLTRGTSTIYSNECWSREKTLLTANIDIPADANPGLWDVHAPSFFDGELILPDGFMVVQPGDWTGDGIVNFLDFAVIANNWLEGADE